MKIGVVGAGAMGSLLGSCLARGSNEVWLVDVWQEHVQEIVRNGLKVIEDEGQRFVHCNATTKPNDVGICDVVIVSTKFKDTETAIKKCLSMIGSETYVMTVQNGIGNVDIIEKYVDSEHIVFGLTTLGAVVRNPGEIEITFGDHAETHVWPRLGDPDERLKKVVRAMNDSGFQIQLSPDVESRIWKKVCLNAGFSVLTAITQLTCGDMIAQPAAVNVIQDLVREICLVAHHENIDIDTTESIEYVINLGHEAPRHKTSIQMDVLNERQTEIDSLNGAVVLKAKKHGLEVPVNETILNIVKILQNTYNKRLSIS
jgi:2-dehydropantoate 2-reductase